MAHLHEHPGDDWTLEKLAKDVGLSRSALAERFTHFVGDPPMQYLGRWRMQVAARLLADGDAKVASVARRPVMSAMSVIRQTITHIDRLTASWESSGLPAMGADLAPAEPSTERQQLDLFVDGRDAFLVHEVVTALRARDRGRAEAGLERLRDEHPHHPDLMTLALLIAALHSPPPAPVSHTTVTAGIEAVDRGLAPAARRILGKDAATFVRPSWQTLAMAAADLPFDEAFPRAHRSWLCQQYGDWPAVRAAVEAERDWAARPRLRYRLGLARHHLGEPEGAIRLWLPLCWMDPALFARCAPTLPSAILREGWEAFERAAMLDEAFAETADATGWFPAWLLPRHRGLAHLFQAGEIPVANSETRVFRQLLSLVPLEFLGLSDALVRERRALQQLSPAFFRYYMATKEGRD